MFLKTYELYDPIYLLLNRGDDSFYTYRNKNLIDDQRLSKVSLTKIRFNLIYLGNN